VLAIPAEDAGGLVAAPDLANRLGAFHRAPAALVYLGFPAAAVERARDGFGLLAADLRAIVSREVHRRTYRHLLSYLVPGGENVLQLLWKSDS
jgi:hypothetical protein